VETTLAIARAVNMGATLLAFGQLAFLQFVSPGRVLPPRFLAVMAWSLAATLASALAWLALEALNMSGLPFPDALAPAIVGTVLAQTLFGKLWVARAACLAVLAASVVFMRHRGASRLAFASAALLLLGLGGMGHAAAGGGSEVVARLGADCLHLLAAGAWLGSLPPLIFVIGAAMTRTDAPAYDAARGATQRFSALGVASVGTLLLTGIASSFFALHDLPALYESDYGRLLLAKVALFVVMLVLATVNRFVLTPRLEAHQVRQSLVALRRNAIAELLLGLGVVCVVAKLGITMPDNEHEHHHHHHESAAASPAQV
jgi:putative copper resistance protein D